MRPAWSIDAGLLRDILIQGYSNGSPTTEASSMFGGTLVRISEVPQEARTEFDLVGSVGLFGHRAVPKETPLYPPNEPVTTPFGRTEYITRRSNIQGGIQGRMNEDFTQDDWFLGASEYGQAIETWLDSNAFSQ
jgi:hypothetical protein